MIFVARVLFILPKKYISRTNIFFNKLEKNMLTEEKNIFLNTINLQFSPTSSNNYFN
jgi:hypothetical protein